MYDLIDRPVTGLPRFERTLLDATRGWVHARTLTGAPPPEPDRAFDRAMGALDAGSAETWAFARPCHDRVEEAEAVVIGVWRLVRAGRLSAAHGAIGTLVDDRHAPIVLAAMIDWVARHS